MTNPDDEARLNDPDQRARLTDKRQLDAIAAHPAGGTVAGPATRRASTGDAEGLGERRAGPTRRPYPAGGAVGLSLAG